MGILIAFWVFFTFIYLVATELFSMAKSKGEVLIFRRSHFNNKKSLRRMAETHDEEASGAKMAEVTQSAGTDKINASYHEGQTFHWEDVCYDITNKGEVRRILDHVDGWVQPGTLTALMVRMPL